MNSTKYKCEECNKYYATYSSLWTHNKKFHIVPVLEENKKRSCCYCYKLLSCKQSKWYHEKKCKEKINTPLEEKVKQLSEDITKIKQLSKDITKIKEIEQKQKEVQKINTSESLVNEQLLNIIMEKSLSINQLKQDLNEFKNKEINTNAYFLSKQNEPFKLNINNKMFILRTTDNYFNVSEICKFTNKDFNNWYILESTKQIISELSLQLNVNSLNLIEKNNNDIWLHPTLTLLLGQWISPHFSVQSCLWLTSFLLNYDENIKNIEAKNIQISTLKNIFSKKQTRQKYCEKNIVYVITTEDLKNKRTYIVGLTQNLQKRLSTYNKTCEHEVIYYKECGTIENMKTAENLVLEKLNKYRERANRDRFIIPIDKDITIITNIIDSVINFLSDNKNTSYNKQSQEIEL